MHPRVKGSRFPVGAPAGAKPSRCARHADDLHPFRPRRRVGTWSVRHDPHRRMRLLVGPRVDVHADVLPVRCVVPGIEREKGPVGFLPSGYRKLVELAAVPEGILRPGLDDDVEAFTKESLALRVIAPVRVEVELNRGAFVETPSRPEIDPTLGHVVEQGNVLGHPERVPVGQDHRGLAHSNVLAMRSDVGPHENGVRRGVHEAVVRKVVFREPDRREPRPARRAADCSRNMRTTRSHGMFSPGLKKGVKSKRTCGLLC